MDYLIVALVCAAGLIVPFAYASAMRRRRPRGR